MAVQYKCARCAKPNRHTVETCSRCSARVCQRHVRWRDAWLCTKCARQMS